MWTSGFGTAGKRGIRLSRIIYNACFICELLSEEIVLKEPQDQVACRDELDSVRGSRQILLIIEKIKAYMGQEENL